MADGDCGVPVKKEFCHRESDYLAAADDDGSFALDLDSGFIEHTDDAFRGARDGARLFLPQCGNVERVEAVHVLVL